MNRYFAKRVAAAAIVGIFVFLSTRPALSTPPDLLPDLVTLPPGDFWIEVVNGEKRLHLRNEVGNVGAGALEMDIQRPDTSDCDGDGDPDNDRLVYQRIFQDANTDGIFIRKTDKNSRLNFAGCMIFHPAHNHWHFNDFAQYELKTLAGDPTPAPPSLKVTFCVIDGSRPFSQLPGSPSSPYYKSCGKNFKQGLSVGWSDVYRSTLVDQYIVITGISDGDYCVVSTANPPDELNNRKLVESNYSNNSAGTKITLKPNNIVTSDGSSCP